MLTFKPLDKNLPIIKSYSDKAGDKPKEAFLALLETGEFNIEYAIFNQALILKENIGRGKIAFYYPVGEKLSGCLEAIEGYCEQNKTPLIFCLFNDEDREKLASRYPFTKVKSIGKGQKGRGYLEVKTAFTKIKPPVFIEAERLTVEEILETDGEKYRELYLDDELNKLWGYDYREDLTGEPNEEYFLSFMQGLKEREEEYSLAVKKDGEMIGELVMHGFDYLGGVEIGFRIARGEQRKGYAEESARALIRYIERKIKPTKIKAKCFIENLPSRALLLKLGFKKVSEEQNKIYFIKE